MGKLSDKELMPIIYKTFIESETTQEFYEKMSKITSKDKKHIKYSRNKGIVLYALLKH